MNGQNAYVEAISSKKLFDGAQCVRDRWRLVAAPLHCSSLLRAPLSLQTRMTQNPQQDRAAEARSRGHPHLTQHLAQKVPDKRLRKDTEPSALEAWIQDVLGNV